MGHRLSVQRRFDDQAEDAPGVGFAHRLDPQFRFKRRRVLFKKKKNQNCDRKQKKIIRNYGISQFGDFDAGVAGAAAERLHLQLGLAVQLPCDVGRAWISCKIDGDVTRLAEHETVQRHLIFGLRRDCDG